MQDRLSQQEESRGIEFDAALEKRRRTSCPCETISFDRLPPDVVISHILIHLVFRVEHISLESPELREKIADLKYPFRDIFAEVMKNPWAILPNPGKVGPHIFEELRFVWGFRLALFGRCSSMIRRESFCVPYPLQATSMFGRFVRDPLRYPWFLFRSIDVRGAAELEHNRRFLPGLRECLVFPLRRVESLALHHCHLDGIRLGTDLPNLRVVLYDMIPGIGQLAGWRPQQTNRLEELLVSADHYHGGELSVHLTVFNLRRVRKFGFSGRIADAVEVLKSDVIISPSLQYLYLSLSFDDLEIGDLETFASLLLIRPRGLVKMRLRFRWVLPSSSLDCSAWMAKIANRLIQSNASTLEFVALHHERAYVTEVQLSKFCLPQVRSLFLFGFAVPELDCPRLVEVGLSFPTVFHQPRTLKHLCVSNVFPREMLKNCSPEIFVAMPDVLDGPECQIEGMILDNIREMEIESIPTHFGTASSFPSVTKLVLFCPHDEDDAVPLSDLVNDSRFPQLAVLSVSIQKDFICHSTVSSLTLTSFFIRENDGDCQGFLERLFQEEQANPLPALKRLQISGNYRRNGIVLVPHTLSRFFLAHLRGESPFVPEGLEWILVSINDEFRREIPLLWHRNSGVDFCLDKDRTQEVPEDDLHLLSDEFLQLCQVLSERFKGTESEGAQEAFWRKYGDINIAEPVVMPSWWRERFWHWKSQ